MLLWALGVGVGGGGAAAAATSSGSVMVHCAAENVFFVWTQNT